MSLNNNNHMDLWKRYAKDKDLATRERLIITYAHLVKYVAGRLSIYFGSNVEYDDLVSFGTFGLIDAIDKYDISKGTKFETYASLRIRGAIIDSIRDMDWVPRSLRQKNKDLERVYYELENELGRSASDQEVADKLGVSIEEFHKLLSDANIMAMVSLDEFLEQNVDSAPGLLSGNNFERPEGYMEITEIKEILADAISKLPEKEKNVVALYYYEELTLKEISSIMKVSESRISQLHTKAILRLKGRLNRNSLVMNS